MGEGFVGFRHLLEIFTTLARRADAVAGVENFVGHALGHRALTTIAREADHPTDGERGGALALWNESASDEAAEIDLYLGEIPRAIDVFGNEVKLVATEQGHRLSLSKMPIVVTGVDAFEAQIAHPDGKRSVEARTLVVALRLVAICDRNLSGDIDAGAVLHLMRSESMSPDELDQLLNRKSGLRGLSGVGNDMRDIEQRAAEGDDRCRVHDCFVWRDVGHDGAR